MSSVPHNHHFVPQFLLRNFLSDQGKIWVYDTEAKTIKSRSTKGAASVEDLYATKKSDGSIDFQTIEDYFSRMVENDAALAIRKLLNREFLSTEEALSFFQFVAAQLCRTPAFFSQMHGSMAPVLQEMGERMAKYDPQFREGVTARMKARGCKQEEIDGLFAAMTGGGMKITPSRDFVLQQSLVLINKLAEHFTRMHWCYFVVSSGDSDLILGDHPMTLYDGAPSSDGQRPFGILTPGVEIMLPLSRRMLAIGRWGGPVSYGELEPGAVEVANGRAMRASQRYIYASYRSDALLQEAIAQKAYSPKLRVQRVAKGKGLVIATSFY